MKRFIFSIFILALLSISHCEDGEDWDYKSRKYKFHL